MSCLGLGEMFGQRGGVEGQGAVTDQAGTLPIATPFGTLSSGPSGAFSLTLGQWLYVSEILGRPAAHRTSLGWKNDRRAERCLAPAHLATKEASLGLGRPHTPPKLHS